MPSSRPNPNRYKTVINLSVHRNSADIYQMLVSRILLLEQHIRDIKNRVNRLEVNLQVFAQINRKIIKIMSTGSHESIIKMRIILQNCKVNGIGASGMYEALKDL